jgi:ammonium transporter, Amt family
LSEKKYFTMTSSPSPQIRRFTVPRALKIIGWGFALVLLGTTSALAQDTAPAAAAAVAPTLDAGNTAWLLASTALVLFMMIPGLALFYAGLVRARNVLSVLMQCFALTAVLSLVWLAFGYSAAFTEGSSFIGSFSAKAFMRGTAPGDLRSGTTIPEFLYFAYQMTFFVITPGLIVGAVVERMKFTSLMIFMTLWAILVYLPVCYMVWFKGNYFGLTGVIDHAGGIVVHITAGVAALVACIVVGKRADFGRHPTLPHNLPMTVTGAAMLWVGWFGFNAGSGLAADGGASLTLVVTHLSACVATLVWMGIEWIVLGRPTVLGAATGSIAGLAAITPAAGSVGPTGALIIGAVSAAICWFASVKIKSRFKYDDSLDVFGVHGIGGFVGTVLVGILAHDTFGGLKNEASLTTQTLAAVYTAVYSAVVSLILLYALKATIGLRVTPLAENEGLDSTEHGENAYNN